MTRIGRANRTTVCALASTLIVAGFAASPRVVAEDPPSGPSLRAAGAPPASGVARAGRSGATRHIVPNAAGVSASIRSLSARRAAPAYRSIRPELYPPRPRTPSRGEYAHASQPVTPSAPGAPAMPAASVSFDGINANGLVPADTTGDVGPNHYVQAVNIELAIYNKTGTYLSGSSLTALWAGLPGTDAVCENFGFGDPIVLYDPIADRWLITQFAFFDLSPSSDYHQCIAVSQTADPTGSYHLYDYTISETALNDYPKFGVWPDGYYMAINQFDESTLEFVGAAALVFDRDAMLAGQSAGAFIADLSGDLSAHSLLPSDLDGPTLPPFGAPNYFVSLQDGSSGNDKLRLFEFAVDWSGAGSASFNETSQIGVTNFTGSFACGDALGQCVSQPGTSERLDQLSDRLMFRLAYRNYGSHESLVVTHTVNNGSGVAAPRWYEVRNPGAAPTSVYYETTYNPGDGIHRWMASVAMDDSGNVALGYSVSDGTAVFPGIRYQGWQPDSGSYTMDTEAVLVAGAGSQTNSDGRWGDYSAMTVDPGDGCTFWYSTEYMAATSASDWSTRVGAFAFPGCTGLETGAIQGTVTDSITGLPIPGALVRAGTFGVNTGNDGTYSIPGAPVGDYTVTVTAKPVYAPGSGGSVSVTAGVTVTADVALDNQTASDFNGDGAEDLAIGAPGETISGRARAGVVHILYGRSGVGLTAASDEYLHQDVAGVDDVVQAGDEFGAVLAPGDFNKDGLGDLAVGIPGQDVGSARDAGAIAIFYGHSTGLIRSNGVVSGDRIFRQGAAGIAGTSETGDRFGAALAAADFNGDGYTDLAVGVPGEDLSGKVDTGGVSVLYGSASGLSGNGDQYWHQDTVAGGYAVNDVNERGDFFGAALAAGNFNDDDFADIAIGIPGEDLGSRRDAGAVGVLYGSASKLSARGDQTWHQNVSGIDGTAATGDEFGDSLAAGNFDGRRGDDLAVGIAGDNAGGDDNSGSVAVLYSAGGSGLSAAGDQLWHQDRGGIHGTTQRNDFFGFSLAAGNFDAVAGEDLAIGVPGDVSNTGSVAVLYSAGNAGLSATGNDLVSQSTTSALGGRTRGNLFGYSVVTSHVAGGRHAWLYAGAPGDDVGAAVDAGTVAGLPGKPAGLTSIGARLWNQNSTAGGAVDGTAERSDRFGAALG